jgi:hypothetical protein
MSQPTLERRLQMDFSKIVIALVAGLAAANVAMAVAPEWAYVVYPEASHVVYPDGILKFGD